MVIVVCQCYMLSTVHNIKEKNCLTEINLSICVFLANYWNSK
jgi:hypothetical protein